MFLQTALRARAAERPVRVCLIGAGKFGSMFLSQVPTTRGVVVTAIADLRVDAARAACRRVGWSNDRVAATRFTDDAASVLGADDVDVVVADVLAGVALGREAASAGVVYSLAYGDQPALVAEMVEWARCCGFSVAAAGKGTKHMAHYHRSTPDTVWNQFGITPEAAHEAGMNPNMFHSFVDGTKSGIEMAAIANSCDLAVPSDGLLFPPCGVHDLAHVLRPRSVGGLLERSGITEVVTSMEPDGRQTADHLRWGVYVVLEAPNDYAAACFKQYGMAPDATGRYAAMYRPFHLIGLELNMSILLAALDGRATGTAQAFVGDAVACAKRDLSAGEVLDGEGGYTVWGKLVPASRSLGEGALPIGLAQDVTLVRDVAEGQILTMADVALPADDFLVAYRRAMEEAERPRLAAE